VSTLSGQSLSRLELYIEILNSIEELQASSLLTLQEKNQIEKGFLLHAIDFLEKQGLIQKEYVGDNAIYSTTTRGERVTRYFSVHQQKVPHEEISLM
jgi:predicted transcriptional regulator